MSHRIVKVAKHFNRPINELVELLKQHGFVVLPTPTARISYEMIDLLHKHYGIFSTQTFSFNQPNNSITINKTLIMKGDGFYQIPFKKLKFKDGLMYIQFEDPFLGVLTYKPQDLSIFEMIKSKYSTSNEFLGISVVKKKITNIDNEESLLIKLKISKPKKRIEELLKTKKSKDKIKTIESAHQKPKKMRNRVVNNPIPESNISKPQKRKRIPNMVVINPIPESKLPKPTIPLPTKEIQLKANLSDIATFYSITTGDIINYLRSRRNRKFYPLSSQLSVQEVEIIQAHFMPLFRKKYPSAPLYKIEWIDLEILPINIIPPNPPIPLPEPAMAPSTPEIPQIFSINSSFEGTKFDFELKTDKFTTSVSVVSYPGLANFHTYFTDSQAVDICSKMSSSLPRARGADFGNPNNSNKELTRYEIHFMANKALNIFGGKILTLLSDLRKLKFKTRTAYELRTYRTVRPDFPFLHFRVGGSVVNVAFFTREHKMQRKLTANTIIYSDKYQRVGFIDELGRVKLELKNFSPQLSLFINKVKDKNYQIYSGVETGVCDICKLPLSHPNSLLFGIGPVCAKKLNIDLRSMNL